MVVVGDRESDIYALFRQQASTRGRRRCWCGRTRPGNERCGRTARCWGTRGCGRWRCTSTASSRCWGTAWWRSTRRGQAGPEEAHGEDGGAGREGGAAAPGGAPGDRAAAGVAGTGVEFHVIPQQFLGIGRAEASRLSQVHPLLQDRNGCTSVHKSRAISHLAPIGSRPAVSRQSDLSTIP